MKCAYCGNDAQLVTGLEVYPRRTDLYDLKFWRCEPCQAFVGCHKPGVHVMTPDGFVVSDGTVPFGRLANANLRRLKALVHQEFDPIWKNKEMGRKTAYLWLANKMGMPFVDCHIGNFDDVQCEEAIMHCMERRRRLESIR